MCRALVVPRCVYTEPELAAVGLTAAQAAADGVALDAYACSMEHNDRAILEGDAAGGAAGFATVLCEAGTDTIVGATVVGAHAGEIIGEITVCIKEGVGIGRLARVIHPYPTTAEAVMGCGLAYIRKHWARLD